MDYQQYLPLVKDTIIEAGKEIMKIYRGEIKVEQKEDKSPITQADVLANTIISQQLESTGIPILSEESEEDANRFDSDAVWIIDPIDGTKGFINKDGEFAIQIGLTYHGIPVLGVVYMPAFDKLYYALRGEGAVVEEGGVPRKLEVDKKASFENAHIFMSKNHVTQEMIDFAKSIGIEEIHHCGGIGVKFSLIAEGKSHMDFKLEGYCSEWDLCAPQIILEEAGGYVYDTYGNQLEYNTNHTKIANGYIATTIEDKEKILQHIMDFRKTKNN